MELREIIGIGRADTDPMRDGAPRPLPASRARRLVGADEGAIIVFGVFFAAFVAGMLYYVVGLGNAILYRERLQDAADSAAFAGAVVHARGMNLLALINMVMAALLSILVTLKLIEALIIVAQVIMSALSWFFGATAGVAAALQVVRTKVNTAAETAEPLISGALEVLHNVGDVVRVVVPIGANAAVIPTVGRQYDVTAVAIPARLTLPVQDDEYSYLCGKAGIMAAELALLPLRPILPSFIENGVRDAVGNLTEAMSGWFCGEEGAQPPTFDLGEMEQQWPTSSEMERCTSYQPAPGDDQNQGVRNCQEAERVDMLATPHPQTGRCRVGDVVCVQVPDQDSPTGFYQPREDSYCAGAGQTDVVRQSDCSMDGSTPYGRRLLQSRENCRPRDGAQLRGYWWLEKQVTVTWRWVQDGSGAGTWTRVGETETQERSVKHDDPDSGSYRDIPCGPEARTRPWNTGDLSQHVCSTEGPPPTGRPSIPRGQNQTMYERQVTHTVVTQVLGCGQAMGPRSVTVGNIDLSEDAVSNLGGGSTGAGGLDSGGAGSSSGGGASGAGGSGGQGGDSGRSKNPFRFEENHLLGTSDMQIRSLVFAESIANTQPSRDAERIIRAARWEDRRQSNAAFLRAAQTWGQFGVAQAEYYFDQTAVPSDDAFCDAGNPRDWLWYIGWTARLRRFRLNWEGEDRNGRSVNADGDSQRGQDDRGGIAEFAQPDLLRGLEPNGQANGMLPACSGGQCQQATGDMMDFQDLFLH